jgi:electron transport complex protein RnfG
VVSARYDVLEGGKPVGMLLQLTGSGYGGDLKILARYQLDGAIVAVELLEDSETPGLGKKAESPSYMEKFVGTGSPEKPVPVRKDMLSAQQADAVTGATITFMGISKALADGAAYVRQTAGTQKE